MLADLMVAFSFFSYEYHATFHFALEEENNKGEKQPRPHKLTI
jgi:hypothetical protein